MHACGSEKYNNTGWNIKDFKSDLALLVSFSLFDFSSSAFMRPNYVRRR